MAGGTSLNGLIKLALNWDFKNFPASNFDETKSSQSLQFPPSNDSSYSQAFSSTATSPVASSNQLWADRRFVTTSTGTDDLDLAGSLTNFFGETITFATIRVLVIFNRAIVAGDDIDIGGAAANPITSILDGSGTAKMTVRASGLLVLTAPMDGYAVAGGSADTLRVTHAGSSEAITYDIVVIGTE